MTASIIIRTKNEQRWIGEVIKCLNFQTFKDFEIVIVDSGSSDKTLSILLKLKEKYNFKDRMKIYHIPAKNFTYPYSCNYGASKSDGKFLIYISAHSLPIGKYWLKNGLEHFSDPQIAGVYGNVRSLPDGTFWDQLYYNLPHLLKNHLKRKIKVISKPHMGILGNTNSIIRKNLWQKHKFDEINFSNGGEDGEWAVFYLKKGLKVIKDSGFSVRHSHYNNPLSLFKEYCYWRKLTKQILKIYYQN